jgi:hypothetical protein
VSHRARDLFSFSPRFSNGHGFATFCCNYLSFLELSHKNIWHRKVAGVEVDTCEDHKG